MAGWALLLRGINVGGRAAVDMAWLRETVAGLGLADVRTHLTSGNVVGSGTEAVATRAVTGLETALEELSGRDMRVLLRSADQLAAVVALDAFPDADPSRVAVYFVERSLTAADRAAVAAAAGPAGYALTDTEAVLHHPHGMGRLRPRDEPRLDAVVTVRNLRTTTRLAELTAAL